MLGRGQLGTSDGAVTAFGPLLRRLRMAAGLSQEALAERARISTEAVGALERGTRQAPQRLTLALLIEALAVDGADRERLEAAAVRPSVPRRRAVESSLVGVVSALRLPAPLTSFVGRELDLTVVLAALSEARLLSLVGPGGVGKSRLGLEAARRAGERFNEGVALLELAPVAAGAAVVSAFAAALGVADEGTVRLLDRLVAVCGDGRRLIVVDNCEHLLDDVAAVVFALLRSCPNLRVIATTREPLRVDGERIFRLGPLSADAAVELFVDRAKAVAPYLHFDPEARRLAGLICRRVDGIPLAIELAASRSDVFDLSTILRRLQERFKLLAARSRTTHPHHRTLQALVDWSYDLLDPAEVRVFRRLGIFAGGGRFDDAERILAFDGVTTDRVAELLARLHDKSLVDVDRTDPPRFSMLQTIHDYALQRLDDSHEAVTLGTRYATQYLELAVAAGPALRSGRQAEAIARLSADLDNVRASLGLSGAQPALRELGLCALGALAMYWLRIGALTDGMMHIEPLLAGSHEPSLGLAWASVGAAFIEFNRGHFGEGSVYAAQALEAATACGDEWLTIYTSNAVCAARSALGERPSVAAAATYERAQRLGDPWLIGGSAFQLGWAAMYGHDSLAAAGHLSEALDCAHITGDEFMVMTSSLHLGRALTEREPRRAAQLINDAVVRLAPGSIITRARCIEALSAIALVLERTGDAARLADIAGALRTSLDTPQADHLGERGGATLGAANEAIRIFLEAVT